VIEQQRGFSERAIAAMLGINRNTASKYASAISPPISHFSSLAQLAEMPIERDPC